MCIEICTAICTAISAAICTAVCAAICTPIYTHDLHHDHRIPVPGSSICTAIDRSANTCKAANTQHLHREAMFLRCMTAVRVEDNPV